MVNLRIIVLYFLLCNGTSMSREEKKKDPGIKNIEWCRVLGNIKKYKTCFTKGYLIGQVHVNFDRNKNLHIVGGADYPLDQFMKNMHKKNNNTLRAFVRFSNILDFLNGESAFEKWTHRFVFVTAEIVKGPTGQAATWDLTHFEDYMELFPQNVSICLAYTPPVLQPTVVGYHAKSLATLKRLSYAEQLKDRKKAVWVNAVHASHTPNIGDELQGFDVILIDMDVTDTQIISRVNTMQLSRMINELRHKKILLSVNNETYKALRIRKFKKRLTNSSRKIGYSFDLVLFVVSCYMFM